MSLVSEKTYFDQWDFCKEKASKAWLSGRGHSAHTIELPHCWNATDTFQDGLKYYRGWGSYRTTINLNELPQSYTLSSDGFYGLGEIWINGKIVHRFDAAFLGFHLECSKYLRVGANTIALRITNKCPNYVLPGIKEPDFVLHGGLASRVYGRSFQGNYFVRHGLEIVTNTLDLHEAQLTLKLPVVKAAGSSKVQLTVWDADDHVVAEATQAEGTAFVIRIENPLRWDVDSPILYRAIFIHDDGDMLEASFGLRDTEWKKGEGFFLNGRRLDLRGVNRHESMPGFGNALPHSTHEADAHLIKACGFNMVRLSHYPQNPAFLNACDRLGILVYAEIASWKSVRGGRWLQRAVQQMTGMIQRDRTHPSIILWGMGNEGRHKQAYETLGNLVKSLDPTRPTIYAENHQYRAKRHGTQASPDIMGVNYELDAVEEARDASKNQILLFSELSNCPRWRGDERGEAEQWTTWESDLKSIAHKDYIAGYTLWCLCDYATMRKIRFRRPSGIFDAWRQPKLAADRMLNQSARMAKGRPTRFIVTSRRDEQWLQLDIFLLDQEGGLCANHQEILIPELSGDVHLQSYSAKGEIMMSKGSARCFIKLSDNDQWSLQLRSKLGIEGVFNGNALSLSAEDGFSWLRV